MAINSFVFRLKVDYNDFLLRNFFLRNYRNILAVRNTSFFSSSYFYFIIIVSDEWGIYTLNKK